jgi:hypothetical protein
MEGPEDDEEMRGSTGKRYTPRAASDDRKEKKHKEVLPREMPFPSVNPYAFINAAKEDRRMDVRFDAQSLLPRGDGESQVIRNESPEPQTLIEQFQPARVDPDFYPELQSERILRALHDTVLNFEWAPNYEQMIDDYKAYLALYQIPRHGRYEKPLDLLYPIPAEQRIGMLYSKLYQDIESVYIARGELEWNNQMRDYVYTWKYAQRAPWRTPLVGQPFGSPGQLDPW